MEGVSTAVFHAPPLPGHHAKLWIVAGIGLVLLVVALRTPIGSEKAAGTTAATADGLPVIHVLTDPARAPRDAITGDIAR